MFTKKTKGIGAILSILYTFQVLWLNLAGDLV